MGLRKIVAEVNNLPTPVKDANTVTSLVPTFAYRLRRIRAFLSPALLILWQIESNVMTS